MSVYVPILVNNTHAVKLVIHPSFFRRHGFRWLETQPELTETGFIHGYGRPLEVVEGNNADTRRKWLKEQGILQAGWFYTEREEAQTNEADELIKVMGIEKGSAEKPEPKRKVRYSPPRETERGMGLRLEDIEIPNTPEPDDMPDFSPEDLRLSPEALYRKLMQKRRRA